MSPAPHRFVLVHSPLVGPGTWEPVAHALRAAGDMVAVPALDEGGEGPWWERHVRSVALQVPGGPPVVLVGHSGAGALLAPLTGVLDSPIDGAVFVDAGLPTDGDSRLDAMADEDEAFAREVRAHLEGGGAFPDWSDDDLVALVPDATRRRDLLAGLRPRALEFFTEPIPTPEAWSSVPCAYLRLSPAYDRPASRAQAAGWPCEDVAGGHFAILRDPDAVAAAIRRLHAALARSVPPDDAG